MFSKRARKRTAASAAAIAAADVTNATTQEHKPQQQQQKQQQQQSKKQQAQPPQPSSQPLQPQLESSPDWEAVEVKVEEVEAEASACDIKPDVQELQLELLRQQQQHQLLPPTKRFVLIDYYASAGAGAGAATATAKQQQSQQNSCVGGAATATNISPQATGAATASSSSPTISRFLDDAFLKDEIDLQESDTDEEGYSDIDFDDDDELIEDDEDVDPYDPVWTDQPTAPRLVFNFERPVANVGLEGRPKSVNPVFYFDKLVGDREAFFASLADSTNKCAQQILSDNNNVGQTYVKEVSGEEMKIFVGLCLQMSALKLPTLADYWNEEAYYGFKGFGSKMSLNRFQMLLRVLSFENLDPPPAAPAPSMDQNKPDLLAGLNPLLNFFNRRMEAIYKCGQRLVLNEPIVYWKGKLGWAKDLSDKFRCNAVKLHFLTEHTGLLLKIVVDVETKERKAHLRNTRLLVEQRVSLAKRLLKEKMGYGHTVFVSKYYSSYALGHELANYQTYCTGFLDNKRYGNCKQLILTNPKKNTFITKYAPPLMMGKWRRREKCVYFYSSDCLAIYAKETLCRGGDARPKLIKELDWQLKSPLSIREHMLSYQIALERRETKWDKQLAIYVFNLIMLNAYILYTMHAQFGRARIIELHLKDTTKLKSYVEFRQDVIASLLQTKADEEKKTTSLAEAGEKAPTNNAVATTADSEEDEVDGERSAQAGSTAQKQLLEVEHLPMVIPRRKGKVMKKKCRICRKGGMLTFSKLCCEVCPGMPGLCETPCFKIWHDHLKKSLEAGESIKTRIFGTSGEKTIYF